MNTFTRILTVALTLAYCGASRAQQPSAPPPPPHPAGALVAALNNPAASVEEKAAACRQLALAGGKEAVAPLAALLGDAKLSHMARYALETIPDPSADDALRGALATVKGKQLVGVIGSVGVRRDGKAVPALATLLAGGDADVVQAAARALGSVATPEAAAALTGALSSASAGDKLSIAEGLFRCAEAFAATTDRRELAEQIYATLSTPTLPHQVRAGALRGSILTRAAGLSLLKESLGAADYHVFAAAVSTAIEMPGSGVTQVLLGALDQLPADRQTVVLQALGGRRDAVALPTLTTAAGRGEKSTRIAALHAIAAVASPAAAVSVRPLMADPDADVAALARDVLASLPGAGVDAQVELMFKSGSPPERLAAMELMSRRRMTGSVPALFDAASGADADARPIAIAQLGELAGPNDLPRLLELLTKTEGPADVGAAEKAVVAVCQRADDGAACAAQVAGLLPKVAADKKVVVLRVLSGVGGAGALEAFRAVLADGKADKDIRAAAIRGLGAWRSADAAPDLLALAKSGATPTEKILALRGYIGLAGRAGVATGQRLEICRTAAGLVQRPEEKRLLLAALGDVPSPQALSAIAPYLDDAATREEAATATVALSEKLLKAKAPIKAAPAIGAALEKAAAATSNADLSRKAKAFAQQAKAKAPK